ncbi:MAG TPA: nucleotidyl transferase AbiEii/AbiGii toxin family protein [Trebonia sp.]|nr:nucleotidyl transferase AbiEii/AbiGii toxin family protein [Trebonia sp.]
MATDDSEPSLSAFQLEAAKLFFSLPASRGFLLAGGADFFTAPERGHVLAARDALEAAAGQRSWSVQRIHDSDTFCRMVIRSTNASVLIDLAVNAPPDLPPSDTPVGPTLAPEELAGHKLLALFDRAAARDFADVYVLARRFGKGALLARAGRIDAGFDTAVLADMIATLDRFTDDELPVPDGSSAAELRRFYATWRSELAT